MLACRSVFYSVYDLMSLLNHLEQLKQDRLLQYQKIVAKLGMRRLNSEGKKTILGADMETQTPFLELEMAPKQTRPTNQEAHYFTVQMHAKQTKQKLSQIRENIFITPTRNCVKNRIFPTGQKLQSIAACLAHKICTGEKGIK